jgi:cation transport ATPase
MRRHVHRPPLKLRPGHRRWLYLCSVLLLVSGAGWLVAHYFLHGRNDFPGAPHPSEVWWLRLHGAAAMGFFITFGMVLNHHVRAGWRQRVNRSSGVVNLAVIGVLALSAYGLYYIVDDGARTYISVTHWIVGLIAAAALPVHVILGRRQSARREHARTAD